MRLLLILAGAAAARAAAPPLALSTGTVHFGASLLEDGLAHPSAGVSGTAAGIASGAAPGLWLVSVDPATLGTSRAALSAALAGCGAVDGYLGGSSSAWSIHIRSGAAACLAAVAAAPGVAGVVSYPASLRLAPEVEAQRVLRAVTLSLAPGAEAAAVAAALAPLAAAQCATCAALAVSDREVLLTALAGCAAGCELEAPAACGCQLPLPLVQAAAAHSEVTWVSPVSAPQLLNAFARAMVETTDSFNSPTAAAEFGTCADTTCNLQGYFPIAQQAPGPNTVPVPALRRAQQAPACNAACGSPACGMGFGVCSSDTSATSPSTSPYFTAVSAQLSGAGQLIHLVDSGVDTNSPFFYDPAQPNVAPNPNGIPAPALSAHRKIAAYWSFADAIDSRTTNMNSDGSTFRGARGHGTHVAGTLAGDPAGAGLTAGDAPLLPALHGSAPGARLVVTDIVCNTVGGCNGGGVPSNPPRTAPCNYNAPCLPGDVMALYAPARAQGARISSNSWGFQSPTPITAYTATSRALDSYVSAHPDHLFVFAGGDSGGQAALTQNAMAKNIIAVGAINDGLLAHLAKTRGQQDAANPQGTQPMPPLYQPLDGRSCAGMIASAGLQPGSGLAPTANGVGACPATPASPAQCYALYLGGSSVSGYGGFPPPFNPQAPVGPGFVAPTQAWSVPYALGQALFPVDATAPTQNNAELALCCGCSLADVLAGCQEVREAGAGGCGDDTPSAPGGPTLGQLQSSRLMQGLQLTYNARFPLPLAATGPAADGSGPSATSFRIKPDLVAPGLDSISARSTGFGYSTPGAPVRAYGDFACPPTSTFAAGSALPFPPTPPPAMGAAVFWTLTMDTPTTEPIRITSISIPVQQSSAGTFTVLILSTSETQPPGTGVSPYCFAPPGTPAGTLTCVPDVPAGQGLYQSAPLVISLPAAQGAVTLPVGHELGAGWTGRIVVHPQPGMTIAAAPNGAAPGARVAACFAPLLAPPGAPATGGVAVDAVFMSLSIARGGPLSHIAAMSGSSAAAPLVAGAAAQVRQYYLNGFAGGVNAGLVAGPGTAGAANSGFAPSAALLKATLINSASPTAQGAFNALFGVAAGTQTPADVAGAAGFGVPNLVRGLGFAALGAATRASGALPTLLLPGLTTAPGSPLPQPLLGVDPVLTNQGQQLVYCVDVRPAAAAGAAGTLPLSITLVWTDPIAALGAPSQLVNNLDLLLVQPGSLPTIYGNSVNVTSPQQQADLLNNVEKISIPAPLATLNAAGARIAGVPAYRVIVRSTSLPQPPQSFSLVVTGPGISLGVLNSASQACDFAPPPPGSGAAAAAKPAPMNNDAIIAGFSIMGLALVGAALAIAVIMLRKGTAGIDAGAVASWVKSLPRAAYDGIVGIPAWVRDKREAFAAALVPPPHMKSSWLFFLLMVGSFHFVLFANLGLSVFEQTALIQSFGISLADTTWPPIVTGIAGVLGSGLAVVTDRYNFFGLGNRLPYVVLGQTLTCIAYVVVVLLPPTPGAGWAVYLGSYAFRGFAMVLASSAMNGWIVDANIRERIGVVQSVRAIGTMLGLLTVVQGGAQLITFWGFLPPFGIMLAVCVSPFIVLPLMLTGRIREEKEVVVEQKEEPFDWQALRVFTQPMGAAIIFLTVTGTVGNITGNALINAFLQIQKGLTFLEIGHLGTVSLVVNLPGAFLAGYALDNWDVRWFMFWMNFVTALTTLMVMWTPAPTDADPDAPFVYNALLNLVGSFTGQAAQTLIAGVALRVAPPSLGASFLAVIGAVTALVGILGNLMAGQVIANLRDQPLTNFQVSFLVGACVIASGCLVIPFLGAAAQPPPKKVAPLLEGEVKPAKAGGVSSPNPLAAVELGSSRGVKEWNGPRVPL